MNIWKKRKKKEDNDEYFSKCKTTMELYNHSCSRARAHEHTKGKQIKANKM